MTAQTTATVATMPWVRRIEIQRLSCDDRIGHLRELARTREWMDPAWVTILRDSFCHDSLTPQQRDAAWTAVLEAQKRVAEVEVGIIEWDWRCGNCGHPFAASCDDSCCPSAEEHACAVADEALQVLAGGAL